MTADSEPSIHPLLSTSARTLSSLDVRINAESARLIADAEHAIRDLDAMAIPPLAPLTRLLRRTEATASSERMARVRWTDRDRALDPSTLNQGQRHQRYGAEYSIVDLGEVAPRG